MWLRKTKILQLNMHKAPKPYKNWRISLFQAQMSNQQKIMKIWILKSTEHIQYKPFKIIKINIIVSAHRVKLVLIVLEQSCKVCIKWKIKKFRAKRKFLMKDHMILVIKISILLTKHKKLEILINFRKVWAISKNPVFRPKKLIKNRRNLWKKSKIMRWEQKF